ncbi:MAG: phosphoglycerate kinase [Cellvibrionales bacterium]|nr:phosphoglycerate kinase [Cellvibrionales bacterium]
MTAVNRFESLTLSGQRVLIREDLNVPIKDGKITSDKRLQAALPTIKQATQQGAKVLVMSHLGRPTEGGSDADNAAFSLQPVADYLSDALGQNVPLITDYLSQSVAVENGQVVLLENVRFNAGEKKDDDTLAKAYASLCDVFVMDAFGTAHRAQASTHGVAKYAPIACAGPLLSKELDALESATTNPEKPLVAIVGGSKVSTKLEVLETLADLCDHLIVGGGIANTFLAANGFPVGNSLYEKDLLDTAKSIMQKVNIPLPTDVVTGKAFSEEATAETKACDQVQNDDMIFDIGPESAKALSSILADAKTIIWNGPVGVFEFAQFSKGTEAISKAIAESPAFSIAGGGDTLAAVDQFGITDNVSYISTGGGAFLEYVEGKELPAVAILKQRAK